MVCQPLSHVIEHLHFTRIKIRSKVGHQKQQKAQQKLKCRSLTILRFFPPNTFPASTCGAILAGFRAHTGGQRGGVVLAFCLLSSPLFLPTLVAVSPGFCLLVCPFIWFRVASIVAASAPLSPLSCLPPSFGGCVRISGPSSLTFLFHLCRVISLLVPFFCLSRVCWFGVWFSSICLPNSLLVFSLLLSSGWGFWL